MRTLTFDTKTGDFCLDRHESIGDYIEISDVRAKNVRRINGRECYHYTLCLKFCCNLDAPGLVLYYTFNRWEKLILQEMQINDGVYALRSDLTGSQYKFTKKELVT